MCEHPKFILNPKLPELLGKYHHCYVKGHHSYYPYTFRYLYHLDRSIFHGYLPQVTHKNQDEFYVLDESTGKTYPIYLEVECGHCAICRDKKAMHFVERCRLESQSYDCMPWFTTLTYSNNYLPEDGVSVRDCQLFLKRFRINLIRSGYNRPIRYMLAAQYGPKTFRPHYHVVFWNLHPMNKVHYLQIKQLIQDSWQNGEVRRTRLVDPTDSKSFYYTMRYNYHPGPTPADCNEPFMLSSRGHGGIGAHFLDSIKGEFNRLLSPEFKYKDRFTGQLRKLTMTKYVLDRLVPSFCKLYPSKFRTAVVDYFYCFDYVKNAFPSLTFLYETTYEKIQKFKKHFFVGMVDQHEGFFSCDRFKDPHSRLCECQTIIDRFLQVRDLSDSFAEACKQSQERRERFLDRLSKVPSNVDIGLRRYRAEQRLARAVAASVI